MKYVIYPGCLTLTEQYAYELSTRRVFEALGIELLTPENISCCGAPLRSVNAYGWIYLAARNMAVLEDEEAPAMILCNWCHLSFTHARKLLSEKEELRLWVNELLKEEDLEYRGDLEFKHLIEVLHDDIGIKVIAESVKVKLESITLSPHSGCQLIRPTELGRPDNPVNPVKLSNLIEALGAKAVRHVGELECCGWAIYKTRVDAGLTLAGNRIKAASDAKVDGIIVVCPHGAEMLDGMQSEAGKAIGSKLELPVLYYTQLLGLALGIEPKELGLQLNRSPVERILERISINSS